MLIKSEELKEYIIKHGEKKIGGVGKNRIEVYKCNSTLYSVTYSIDTAGTVRHKCHEFEGMRYNTSRDVVQYEVVHASMFSYRSEWKDLKPKDDSIVVTEYNDQAIEEYRKAYARNNLDKILLIMTKHLRWLKNESKIHEMLAARMETIIADMMKMKSAGGEQV